MCCSRGYRAHASSVDSDDLLNALKDKELLKTSVGFIGGEFVGASDDSTIDVRVLLWWQHSVICRSCARPLVRLQALVRLQGLRDVCPFLVQRLHPQSGWIANAYRGAVSLP